MSFISRNNARINATRNAHGYSGAYRDVNKVTLMLAQRVGNICATIFTLGYHRYNQNKLFKAAVIAKDFEAAKKAIKKGACGYLSLSDLTLHLKLQEKSAVNFLLTQAQFGKSLNGGGKKILKAVQKINITNYEEPHHKLLLKLFLEHRPLNKFEQDYWHGQGFENRYYDEDYWSSKWLHNPNFTNTTKKVDKETFLKCRLFENIWMENPTDTQPFFDNGLDPKSIENAQRIHPLSGTGTFGRATFAAAVKLWLDAGLNPNAPNPDGSTSETLLGRALYAGNDVSARRLITAGADTNKISRTEWEDYYEGHRSIQGTPLELAIRRTNDLETIQQLLAHGAIPTRKALIDSFSNHYQEKREDKTKIISLLLESPLLPPESLDDQVLELAIQAGEWWCIDQFLKKGIVPTTKSLRVAAKSRDLYLATKFVTYIPTIANEKLLQLAYEHNNYYLIRWLLEKNPALRETVTCQKLLNDTQSQVQKLMVENQRLIAEKTRLIETFESK